MLLQMIINALATDHAASQIAFCVFAADQAMAHGVQQIKPSSVETYASQPPGSWTLRRITCSIVGLPADKLHWASVQLKGKDS